MATGRHEGIHWVLSGTLIDQRIRPTMIGLYIKQSAGLSRDVGLLDLVESTYALTANGWRRRDVSYTCICISGRLILDWMTREADNIYEFAVLDP
jgi:hypothetical protein